MTAMHPGTREYRNQTIRLADLTVTSDTIDNVRFENCVVLGPAVLISLGSTFSGCTFVGDADSIIWPIDPQRERVQGAVGAINCEFFNCKLELIGLGVPHDNLEEVRRGLGS